MKTIITRGLSAGSLFKLLFFGSFIPLFLLGVISGISAYMGYNAIMLNEQYVYGSTGLLTGIAFGIISPFIFSILMWILLVIGLWLWTRFTTIDLTYKE